MSLADAKLRRVAELSRLIESIYDNALPRVPAGQAIAMLLRYNEALAYEQSGDAADAPMLLQIANTLGVSIGGLVLDTIAEGERLIQLEVALYCRIYQLRADLAAATTETEVEAIDMRVGWPDGTV